jgi:hypothetical protein
MHEVTSGEQWKMQLLTGALLPSDATDLLLDNRLLLSDEQMLHLLLPMAELRAEQILKGLVSPDDATRNEAERMHGRYAHHEVGQAEQDARQMVSALVPDKKPFVQNVAANWLGKIVSNDLVGELEKDLKRTVDTYKTEKEENQLRLRHRTTGVALQ